MVQTISTLAATTLALCLGSVSSSGDQTWYNQFNSKVGILPQAKDDCFVCFYQQANYGGSKRCFGKRVQYTDANPITAPGTIGSIKFGQGCDLVVNVRVTAVPFDERVDVVSKDMAYTDYNVTTNQQSVQEVYVEEAGCACFLGIAGSGGGYGVCYTDDEPAVDSKYQNSITELLMFKSEAKNFDVIVYENQNYNNLTNSIIDNSQGTSNSSYRFTGNSKNLETNVTNSRSGMIENFQNRVRSIRFVDTSNAAKYN
ncbi:hypothetical protein Plhal304r1_c081g0166801 [Plasmopara halstedii]